MTEDYGPLTCTFTQEIEAVGNHRWLGRHRSPPSTLVLRLATLAGAAGLIVSALTLPLLTLPGGLPRARWVAPQLPLLSLRGSPPVAVKPPPPKKTPPVPTVAEAPTKRLVDVQRSAPATTTPRLPATGQLTSDTQTGGDGGGVKPPPSTEPNLPTTGQRPVDHQATAAGGGGLLPTQGPPPVPPPGVITLPPGPACVPPVIVPDPQESTDAAAPVDPPEAAPETGPSETSTPADQATAGPPPPLVIAGEQPL